MENSLNKSALLLPLALLVIVLLAFGGYYLVQWKKEHLILGVPYYGIYEGTKISTAGGAAAFSVLQYWGDERFVADQISEEFPATFTQTGEITEYPSLQGFFDRNGYRVTLIPDTDMKALKMWIDQDVPVIVSKKITADWPYDIPSVRVIIGYSNPEKIFIVHDNTFGNNYEISYEDFEQMDMGEPYALAIEPTEPLEASLTPPDRTQPYPARHPIMDSPHNQKMQLEWATATYLTQENQDENLDVIVQMYENILSNPGFDTELSPAGRLLASYTLAVLYTTTRLQKHEEALAIVRDVSIPQLEHNFWEPYGGWDRHIPESYYKEGWAYTSPRLLLSLLYRKTGNEVEAQKVYRDVLFEVGPNHYAVQAFHQNHPEYIGFENEEL